MASQRNSALVFARFPKIISLFCLSSGRQIALINFKLNKMKNLRLLLAFGLFLSIVTFASAQRNGQFRALLFTKTNGFHHESIHAGVAAIKQLGDRHFFAVEWHEDPNRFSDENLSRYDVVIFLNTTGDILNDAQQAAFEKYIQSGKGFVGIHSATDTEYEWEWYTKLIGRMFYSHPATQSAVLNVVDRRFPGLDRMPDKLLWTDEWYHFTEEKTTGLNYLITVDESTYSAKINRGGTEVNGMGAFHPISWYHDFDGGRAFYTALGHVPLTFSDQSFLDHLYGGIFWAATGKGIK